VKERERDGKLDRVGDKVIKKRRSRGVSRDRRQRREREERDKVKVN
jgi:hypothetical protein